MKQLQSILQETLQLFSKQPKLFLNNQSTLNDAVLPARWALVPVKNQNDLLKNKSL